jgi:T-complex protein 1 subunit delta
MDKMIQKGDGEVLITNDGATILSQLQVFHPTAQMLVQLSKSQDIEAGDGTTGICVIAGSLLSACSDLLSKGIHPTMVAEAFKEAAAKAAEILVSVARPIDLLDRDSVLDTVNTCLSSKVVHHHSDVLSPIAVDAVLAVIDPLTATNVDLENIKIVKQVGGTMDDSELVRGLVLQKGAKHSAGGPTRMENAKIALIQFCLSAPKTDMENNVVVSDYAAMDRILREERKYILALCKKIKKTGCNVLLIQKSILRDAYNDLSLHFLAKLDIMVVTDVERTDIEFISKTLNLLPVAHVDHFAPNKLGSASLVEEVSIGGGGSQVVKFTGSLLSLTLSVSLSLSLSLSLSPSLSVSLYLSLSICLSLSLSVSLCLSLSLSLCLSLSLAHLPSSCLSSSHLLRDPKHGTDCHSADERK